MTGVLLILAVVVIAAALATWKAPRLTSVILWSLTATIFTASSLLLILPGYFPERALWLALAVPLIWAMFQFWCYWDKSQWRVAGGMIALTLVGGVIVFLVDAPGVV